MADREALNFDIVEIRLCRDSTIARKSYTPPGKCSPLPTRTPAPSIRQLLMRTGAKLRRYSEQMRDGSQQRSPSEVVDALSDFVLSPAPAYAISRIPRRPRLSDQSRVRGSEKHLCVTCKWCHP
jgi:hypothetical protein